MTTETVSLVIGIAGAVVTVIAFFAALAFYHQGNRINHQTEQILARIDAKVGVIQDDYSRIVDRTLDMAGEGSGALVSACLLNWPPSLTLLRNLLAGRFEPTGINAFPATR